MRSLAQAPSKKALWTGRVITGPTVAFLLFDAVIHLTKIAAVVQGFAQLGFPLRLGLALGITELICIALYVCPRTALLGAILLTGYLGGAVAVQLRVGNPLFAEALFPIYVGVLVWGGLYLRDARVRAVVTAFKAPGEESARLDSSVHATVPQP